MSEQEIREGMLLAVWDEPPLDFDPDTLIRRVEQKKSRRRALVTVGVATAMIVVASLALPGLLPRDQDGQLASESQTTSAAPPSESVERKAQRIGDKVSENLGLRMTDLKEIYSNFHEGQIDYPYTPTREKRPGDPEFSGYVYLTDSIGPTALRVVVSKNGFSTNNFCAGATMCQDVQQKDGSVVTQAEFFQGSTQIQQADVARRFESGYVVHISSYAHNPSNGLGPRETVPVGVGVLTTLVTDPSIDWE